MCGICGFYNYLHNKPADPDILLDMLHAIFHRGPDDQGEHFDHDLAIGMRRLSIIDLAGGHQPMYSHDKTIAVVFNGEIYNYREIREELQRQGAIFHTASDTEAILRLYEVMGDDCVHQLRGMFGFAIWDARRRRLFIARDRLGIKPLYYTCTADGLVFGSEIKAMLQHPQVHARLDLDGLSTFLSLKYVPAPQTMFAGIVALPPGYTLACDGHGITLNQYWDLSFARSQHGVLSEAEYTEQLDELLHECVRMHLVSDVPFGAFLSGGVDSSTIVALMSQFLNEPVKTFSVGFEGPGADAWSELPYAHMVAKQYQTDHYDIFIGPREFINLSEKVVWHLDQPIADEASLANYMVAELAARHVKMVLTGEGGDELFAGYARYSGEQFSPIFRHIPLSMRGLAMSLTNRLPGLRRPKIALYALCHTDEVTRLLNWFPLFNSDMKAALLSDTFKQSLPGHSARRVFAEHLTRTDATHVLNRMLYVDTKLWLPDDLLARGDKTSMANSLEARVPLLDHKLVEFAASLPPNLKLQGLTRKYLLKKVARSLLPDTIIDRKKKGFPIPIPVWLRQDEEIRAYVRDTLSPATIRQRGLFEADYVENLLNEHDTGFADHGALIWALLNVELWHRQFIDQQARVVRPTV
ncbi:MAG: asparagine synthase (glutamine-hydrolyzing) [Chloroflexaceae bacterium]|nr:asparagine synthase (glutamine-hydrolyzing) [Chloroflexaceae bacterium]